jgi:hypothetical protein
VNYNAANANKFKDVLQKHLKDPATTERGTYGLSVNSKVFYNSRTRNVVVLDNSGNFLTGFKLKPNTPQYRQFIEKGYLR